MSGIYIASKTKHADKWKNLRSCGFPIVSTWIDEAGLGETKSFQNLWLRCINEASTADVLIVYQENCAEVLKGAFIEVGAALASGKPVFAVGLPETLSVINHPLIIRCDDIQGAFKMASKIVWAINEPCAGYSPDRYCFGCTLGYARDSSHWHTASCGTKFYKCKKDVTAP